MKTLNDYLIVKLHSHNFRKEYLNFKKDKDGKCPFPGVMDDVKWRKMRLDGLKKLLKKSNRVDKFIANILRIYLAKLQKLPRYRSL